MKLYQRTIKALETHDLADAAFMKAGEGGDDAGLNVAYYALEAAEKALLVAWADDADQHADPRTANCVRESHRGAAGISFQDMRLIRTAVQIDA